MTVTVPEPENGNFSQIPNRYLEKLARLQLSPNQWQVVIIIMRKTCGFHKRTDYIAPSQIIDSTGLGKTVVSRCLKSLTGKNVISKNGKHIGFQEDVETWGKKLAVQLTSTKEKRPKVSSIANFSDQKLAEQLTSTDEKVSSIANFSDQKLAVLLTKVSSSANQQNKEINIYTYTRAFEKFWSAYPRKKSKGQAEKAFAKINPDEQLLETMLNSIERAKKSAEWLKDGGRFIQYPATWLNARGWEDEFTDQQRESKYNDGW